MNDKLIGKAQALKELSESGNLPDVRVVAVPMWPWPWPFVDMNDTKVAEQYRRKKE